jgi:hypothetical protein
MGACPIAGVIWQHVHYIVGLQRLGHEVYYIEDSARYPYDPVTRTVSEDWSYAAGILGKLGREFGFDGRWSYRARFLAHRPCGGMPASQIAELYREADVILNVCGAQDLHEDLLECGNLVYVESDPGVEQVKVDVGNASTLDYLGKHRALFTFGENIGADEFPVPLHNLQWLPTRQPVVTHFWKTAAALDGGARFTSIANWSTSGIKDIEWRGSKYLWSKSLEFLRFVDGPRRSGEPFELATTIPDAPTRDRFLQAGWVLSDPRGISVDYDAYREFIQRSKGEFTVAKDEYVRLRTGWFSDRSACYLAAGRPVITQETGFTRHYGGSKGLLAFTELEEIPTLVAEINADYEAHSAAASEIAREYFEAEKVLASLLDRV